MRSPSREAPLIVHCATLARSDLVELEPLLSIGYCHFLNVALTYPPLYHLGDNVLQDVGITVASIPNLQNDD